MVILVLIVYVKDVHQKHERYLGEAIPTPKRQDRLCELNVIEQVVNVCETTIVQDAWARGQDLTVHGWAYRLETGLVNDLGMSISSTEEMTQRYAKSLARYEAEYSSQPLVLSFWRNLAIGYQLFQEKKQDISFEVSSDGSYIFRD